MIVVVDYGLGNLHSIAKALEYVGGRVKVSNKASDIIAAEKIVFPGVGAFPDGMAHVQRAGLIPVLYNEVVNKKKPLLGICLGMQLLASRSYEFRESVGLGIIPGDVVKFNRDTQDIRVPHVGWNTIVKKVKHPLLVGVPDDADFYFVHSYHMKCTNLSDVIALCNYGGSFTAIVGRKNIFATQFHPEKSQRYGLRLLENFIAWNGAYGEE